jgi:hypothetical protein
MNKKYTFTMVVVKPTGKGGKPLNPKPIKPENKSTGGGMMKKYNKGGEMLKGGQKKLDKREIGRRGLDPYAVQPRKPSPQPLDKPKPGIGSLQKADIEKNNKIKQVKAKYASLKETARDELTPMKSDRVFSKYRRPDSAKEFYADEPGSKYEGMAKEAMKEKINYFKNMKRGGLTGGQRKLDKNKDGKISGEDFKMMKAKIGKIATEEKYSTVEFGKTYHPITQSQMSNNIRKNFEGDKKFASSNELDDAHEKLKKNLSDKNVRPSEILKLDKEYEARKERAIKTVQKDLSSRPEMKELRKKTKGTVTDTGSTYSKGGAARTSGMGLQDEKIKPGKVQKVFLGKMIKGAGKSIGRLFGRKKTATATPSGEGTLGRVGIFPGEEFNDGPTKPLIDYGNIKPASKGRMMKASKGGGMMQRPMGGEIKKGYGAARQSGMGLQDENLQPGKSMDYYKDLI